MTGNDDNTTLLTRYLLGELAEDEEVRLEERFFGDADFLDELRSVERDLMDSYVRGELSGESRQRFEGRFLCSPTRRQRVLFADAVAAIDSRHRIPDQHAAVVLPSKNSWIVSLLQRPRVSLALAASVLIAFGSVWWWDRISREELPAEWMAEKLPNSPAPEIPGPTPRPEVMPVPRPDPPPSPPKVATLVLAPRVRSGRGQRLDIGRDTSFVQLDIPLRLRDYAGYTAVLKTANGVEISQSGRLKPSGRDGSRLSVRFPVSQFKTGDYLLVVSGVAASGEREEIADYYFEVRR